MTQAKQQLPNILVIGAGSLGRVYGGLLRRLGAQVTYLVRDAKSARHKNWSLEHFSGKRFEISGLKYIDKIDIQVTRYDMIFVTTRKENIAEVLQQLLDMKITDVPVFIFPPVMDLDDIPLQEYFTQLHAVIPGVVAYTNQGIESFEAKRSFVTTLRGHDAVARQLARLFRQAGLPATFSRNFLKRVMLPSVALIIGFAIIELARADYKYLASHRELLKLAADVLQEIARGIKKSKLGHTYFFQKVPVGLSRYIWLLAVKFLPQKYRAMLGHHTHKVSVQTRQIISDMAQRLEAHQQETRHTKNLFSRLEKFHAVQSGVEHG